MNIARFILETARGAKLRLGAIAEGQFLKRVGAKVIGVSIPDQDVPLRDSDSSNSTTPGTEIASITAGAGKKLVGWDLHTTHPTTAGSQVTVTITYTDLSTITHTSTSGRNEHIHANAGGIVNETSGPTLVNGLDKDVKKIQVATAGAGNGLRIAIMSALERAI